MLTSQVNDSLCEQINYYNYADLMAKRQRHKWNADAVLFAIADVANGLWCKSVTSFNLSRRCDRGQRQY